VALFGRSLLLVLSRLASRIHFWTATVLLLTRVRPLTALDATYRGRLVYAALLARGSPVARRAIAGAIRRERRRSPDANQLIADLAGRVDRQRLAALIDRHTSRSWPVSREAGMAVLGAAFEQALADRSLFSAVDSLNLDKSTPLIVVPLSRHYAELFSLWRRQLKRYARGRLVVLAVDPFAAALLADDGDCSVVDVSHHFAVNDDGRLEPLSRRRLWLCRVAFLHCLVARGHTVISLDVDALLVGDLDAMLSTLPAADIVAQQDYSLPMDVARKLRFVLCCGFMVIHPSLATTAFLARYTERTRLEADDQTALNHMLAEAGVEHIRQRDDWLAFDSAGIRWACPSPALASRDLRHGRVIRHIVQLGESVAHIEQMIARDHP
jgi:hypothetical protein